MAEMSITPRTPSTPQAVRTTLNREALLMRGLIVLIGLWLTAFILLPVLQILWRSLTDRDGNFVGLGNFVTYFSTPSLSVSFGNSLYVALTSTLITVSLAFVVAYGLTRTCMPGKVAIRTLAMLPLYAPSLLHGIAFIYLFGNQGLLTTGFFGFFKENLGIDFSINIALYKSPTGIILAEVFYLFPHALLILIISLSLADARLYEAATSLRTSSRRVFWTVTLPGVRYGLISAGFVCFTSAITDFGIPKVIGTSYNVLATDIYKQVVGQQNFGLGAAVSMLLLTPSIIGFIVDRVVQQRQVSMLTARAVPLTPRPNKRLDRLMLAACVLIVIPVVVVMLTALMASLINVWPYKLDLTVRHYDFELAAGGGLRTYWNSLGMAGLTAVFGTIIVFITAYLIEKSTLWPRLRSILYFLCTLPLAVPGLVLGLAYIFFFNAPANPLKFIYGTMAILVLSTIVHFFTVSFFTATTALKQIDREFESVSASLSVPFYRTFWRVTVPVALPAILEIAVYFFVNALTTVSVVIFLYSANLQLAAVAIVDMDDAGDTAPAAAMSMLIFATGFGIRLLYGVITRGMVRRTQAWRER